MLPSNMLLLNLILLIDVTFSTPTPVFVSYAGFCEDNIENDGLSTLFVALALAV